MTHVGGAQIATEADAYLEGLGGHVMCDSGRVAGEETLTVWDPLRKYAATQSGPFTSQEVVSWFRRHAPSQANDRTVRTHVRGACWNVGNEA